MLGELSIKNFAIIESVSISFEKGLTVLTGETGAGKSIIIDAIGLLMGTRASVDFVRHGSKKAEIEGLFLVDKKHPCCEISQELGIEIEDEMLVLRREISISGKSVCRINGKLVTLSILREISRSLIDIHGQHEHQDLMEHSKHLQMLDGFFKEEIEPALQEYYSIYKRYIVSTKKLKEFNENEQKLAQRLDLIQFQLNEIKQANLVPGEDEQLLEEKMELSNYEKIHEALGSSYSAVSGEQKGMDWVGQAMAYLEQIAEIKSEYKELHENISNCFYLLEETSFSLRSYLDDMEYDPNRLDIIQSRLNEISLLKKKYGQTVSDVLEHAATIEDELDVIQNRDEHIEKLKKEVIEISEDLIIEAENLSKVRKHVAKHLEDKIHKELKDLYMEKTIFEIDFNMYEGSNQDPIMKGRQVKFKSDGIDRVEFLIAPNPGEPLKPLSKVASGGELSRMMLAMKSLFSKNQNITSIIFDEVDTGVSGRVAQAMAEKMYSISVDSQVLCITHLPQVAAMADHHLYITKEADGERTKTGVNELHGSERITEIGRMISGIEVTELTKQHAKELLELANQIKS